MEMLLLLILMNSQIFKVSSVPYLADSDGNCRNTTTEYLLDGSKLCCRKCQPGERVIQECSEGSDTLCEPCAAGLFYMENWNYSPNCFSCKKCKKNKGLRPIRQCSPNMNSKCECQPGMYCVLYSGGDYQHCTECRSYTSCKPGYGVSVKGTADSNVRCEPCPSGKFSNKYSHNETCQPHTKCPGRHVSREGSATSDTVCEPGPPSSAVTNAPTQSSTPVQNVLSVSDVPLLSVSPSVPAVAFNYPPKTLTTNTITESQLAALISGITGFILLFTAIILLILWKQKTKKDARRFHPHVNTNGNCGSGDKINQDYLGETQVSFTVNAPEQQCLLETGEACSNYSQSSSSNETRTDGCSSHESIGPLQSTVQLNKEHSIESEPITSLINTEPAGLQPGIPSQPSSQPASLQVNTPVTTNPHVNVNITFHIGNRSSGTSPIIPTDSVQEDCTVPLGEEEECFSVPQQEAGKQSRMAVQESISQCMNSHPYEQHE
ncbi:tumor necrosis factor receptor superfamily member 1B [Thalassophryne amazonica]|uniref:tumor necrosis factor receptor superfamily member 1B n=1 Tax=Thalassophryne amazonica TaxID=390379 RepID=UPI001471AF43|nr:tumor necrosis factor receptor superfamily member 1B [Thalassophryne amazonica]